MSQSEEKRKYRIDTDAYGSIGIEAPTKEEYLDLFKNVFYSNIPFKKSPEIFVS
jgi:hypothetical protein